jgi:DNA (cytosine-5)-methyltransferase 1
MIVEEGEVRTRLLSPREAARLMGISDEFQLPESYNEAYHAMGDGVVVPVVRWLGENLIQPIAHFAGREAVQRLRRGYPVTSISTQAGLLEEAQCWAG